MNEELNPYATPQTPPGVAGFDPARTLAATFPRTYKVHSQMALQAPNAWYRKSAWCLLLSPALIYGLYWLPLPAPFNGRNQSAACWLGGILVPLLIMSVAELIGWWFALQRLRRDPIFGAAGEWLVTIDLTTIALHTAGGRLQWPLATANINTYDKSLGLVVDGQTALYIPSTADFAEETFAIWGETLQQRYWELRTRPTNG